MRRAIIATALALVCVVAARAEVVHVYEQTSAGGVTNQIGDATLETGRTYSTQPAPAISGYIFTGWTISTTQEFDSRDDWGRAFDSAPYKLYETTVLTSNYLAAPLDSDGDGVADGYEWYWYGNLDCDGASDTDGDGVTFAEELAAGTNPLMVERREEGPVTYADGELWLYNPHGYAPYTIRSEPEGALFTTVTSYVRPGESIVTSVAFVPSVTSSFAYWSINGVRQADAWGRALDGISLTMPSHALEIVAHYESDYETRMKLYWYGNAEIAMDSDTDGDGATFAEELAAGTNPLMPERHAEGPVAFADSELWQYNPYNLQPYTIRCEPDGALFAATSDYARAGALLDIAGIVGNNVNLANGLAYWIVNGSEARDEWGRAVDMPSVRMPPNAIELVAHYESDAETRAKLYWYGNVEIAMDSDTDGDGKTFAEELAAGTNPLMAERHEEGPVAYADTEAHEINLQVYEQMQGALFDSGYRQLFYSPVADNAESSATFTADGIAKGGGDGVPVRPIVTDVNGDGLWDLVVLSGYGADGVTAVQTNVLLNTGTAGNPEFAGGTARADRLDLPGPMAAMDALALDVEPAGALSATTSGDTLLVSDADGRIWLYEARATEDGVAYQLQHKVWGGSYAGFANGLMLAAVDWEGDGDLDCLAGTAGGKLMLLRNPKVGRPANLKGSAGVNSVVLTWDPDAQSRIRGYRVYRGVAAGADPAESFESLAAPYIPLPVYRDQPTDLTSEYDYKVASVSRFYRPGNSMPFVSESVATEPLRVAFGGVTITVGDATGFAGKDVEVVVGINNTLGLSGENLQLSIKYDPAVLTPKAVATTGLTEGLTPTSTVADGIWRIATSGGDFVPGEGRVFILTFGTAESAGAVSSAVAVAEARLSLKSDSQATARVECVAGTVTLEVFNPPAPVHATVSMPETIEVEAGESFTLPVSVAGEGVDADTLTYRFDYDERALTLNAGVFTAAEATENVTRVVTLKDVGAQAKEAGREVVFDSIGQCTVTIKAAAVETDPGDGDDAGDTEDGDDETFEDWLENVQGITKFGLGAFGVGDAQGRVGDEVEVGVTLRSGLFFRDLTVDYSKLRFRLAYDPIVLEPIGIAAAAGEYEWSAKDGVLTVCGRSGSATVGRHPNKVEPLAVRFRLREQYAVHTTAVLPMAVQVRTVDGARVFTPVRWPGTVAIDFTRPPDDPSVVAPWSLGDLNGDGRLTKEDRQLLAKLMNGNGKKVDARQLGAGDYNGNGRLDNGDYQLLTEDFRQRGIIK